MMDPMSEGSSVESSSSSEDSDWEEDEEQSEAVELTVTRERQWDVFQEVPPPVDSGSAAAMVWSRRFEKFMLITAFLLTFVLVLTAGIISKGLTMFMVAQVSTRNNRVLEFCNKDRLIPDVSKRYEVQLYRPSDSDQPWTDRMQIQADRMETEQVNHKTRKQLKTDRKKK